MINRIPALLSIAIATTLVATAASSAATAGATTNATSASKIADLIGDPVIAKGKGLEIKRGQLDTEMLAVQGVARAQGRAIAPEELLLLERSRLNDLIVSRLLLNRATDADKSRGIEQFQKALKRLKTDNKLTDAEFDEKLQTQLRLQDLTREAWDKQRVDQATVGAVLERELKVTVSDEAVKKYYDENPARFEQPEQVRAGHILISTRDLDAGIDFTEEQKKAKRKQAEDLRKRAAAGEDFAKLAQEFSEDPGSKDKGGEITLPRGAPGVPPEFEAAAFSLATNQVSDVVTTQIGYHIIKLTEKVPAKMLAFAEVTEDLKEGLKSQEMQKQLRDTDYLETLQKEAGVEILDEKLKQLDALLPKAKKPEAKSETKPDAKPDAKK